MFTMNQQVLDQVKDAHSKLGSAISASAGNLPQEVGQNHQVIGNELNKGNAGAVNWEQVLMSFSSILAALVPVLSSPKVAGQPAAAPVNPGSGQPAAAPVNPVTGRP
jgi:hypothetical protein